MEGDAALDTCVAVRVPAKVNLFLAVRGRRPDGYHELVTVMQTLSIYDEVRLRLMGPPGKGHHPAARRHMRLTLAHDGVPGVPDAAENLAVKAARALGAAAGVTDLAVDGGDIGDGSRTRIELTKGIPVAGGMAGGSADAAAALVGLNELWGCGLSRDELRQVAMGLGSDVPFCVVGGTALATGRGTALAQVLCKGKFHWVVCQSAEPLSTADVYRSWDRVCRPSEVEPDAVLQALRDHDPEALGAALHNDLAEAAIALRPDLAEMMAELRDAGALGVTVSGSGPTLLALAADSTQAAAIAASVSDRFAAATAASSPAGGPDVSFR